MVFSSNDSSANSVVKDVRYDRQLRLWGDCGQSALEKTKICLLNATVTGAEILKSLVLPGIGSFTVVDHRKVTQDDISTNFFVDRSQLGKNLAESLCNHVKELNPDVNGRFLLKNVGCFVENNGDKSFLDQFDLVIGTELCEKYYLEIGHHLFEKRIPFIICKTYGLVGYLRVIAREHFIFDAHPDFKPHNFQLDHPFPVFKQFCDAVNLSDLTHEKHSHVPYLVLLYKAVEKWKATESKIFPSTYADKTKLKSILMSMRMPDEKGNLDEENINEAINAVGSSIVKSSLPNSLKNLFADPRMDNEKSYCKHHFWLMCKALRIFVVEENSGMMPLRGDLPDMISDSDSYVQLQNIYYEEAEKNFRRVNEIVREIASQSDIDCDHLKSSYENGKINQPVLPYSLPTYEQVRAFCKNAAFINVLDSRSLNQEYKIDMTGIETSTKNLRACCQKMINGNDYQNEKRSLDLYIIWRACERFKTEKNRYPGTNGVPENLDKLDLISRIKNLQKFYDLPDEYEVEDALVQEMCRYGACEVHSVASFMGGLAAQESIKLITGMHRNFLLQKHIIFLKRCLDVLPEAYEQLDTSRLTLLYFVLSGLDLVSALDEISPTRKEAIVKWIYSLQLGLKSACKSNGYGFRGSHCNSVAHNKRHSNYDEGHIAMTYSALACLTILNDDLSGLDIAAIKSGIKLCQLPDGSFCGCKDSESDMRFVYCAVASCKIMNDYASLNTEKLLSYVKQCFNYDGGFGQTPGTESHGGSTYCAVAALYMLNQLIPPNTFFSQQDLEKLKKWCLLRQNEGFFGRPNKPDDSCYTFWIGATLKMLDCIHFIDTPKAVAFTLSTQDAQIGGFGKYADVTPDLLHTYLSLAGLSILNMDGLRPLDPTLNITFRSLMRKSQNSIKANNHTNNLPASNAFTGHCI